VHSFGRELLESALLALLEQWWAHAEPRGMTAAILLASGVCANDVQCHALVDHLVARGYLTSSGPRSGPPEGRQIVWTQKGWIVALMLQARQDGWGRP
jgi:hypothetical protein